MYYKRFEEVVVCIEKIGIYEFMFSELIYGVKFVW